MRVRPYLEGAATFLPRPQHGDWHGAPATMVARAAYSVWLRHLSLVTEANAGAPQLDVVVELGPGSTFGVGYAALLCGSFLVHECDVEALVDLNREPEVLAEMVRLFEGPAAIPDDTEFPTLHPRLHSYAFPSAALQGSLHGMDMRSERIKQFRSGLPPAIQYHDHAGVAKLGSAVPPGGADLVISQAVMEYVDDLSAAYSSVFEALRPGGLTSHQIDLGAHQTSPSWDGHWEYGPVAWRVARGRRRHWLNRQPASAHLGSIQSAGFELLTVRRTPAPPTAQGHRGRSKNLSRMASGDRTTRALFVVARKPDVDRS